MWNKVVLWAYIMAFLVPIGPDLMCKYSHTNWDHRALLVQHIQSSFCQTVYLADHESKDVLVRQGSDPSFVGCITNSGCLLMLMHSRGRMLYQTVLYHSNPF